MRRLHGAGRRRTVRSCVTALKTVAAGEITTIEGLEQDGKLHPLQQAFLDAGAMQCGYCTCGMIMSGVGLLRKNPDPTREEIVEHMNGNICRCGTYPRIIAAVSECRQGLEGGPAMNDVMEYASIRARTRALRVVRGSRVSIRQSTAADS